ncbi:MAG: hypothetical protein KJ607_01380, partial [Bacteroidetes bacterium]|nr:hypothetical protein [Bacteroidota bacterium]
MKKTNVICFVLVSMLLFAGCKTVVIPNYTSVSKLSRLNPGMSKSQVLTNLDQVYPHNILFYDSSGCEVHQYLYKKMLKLTPSADITTESGLTEG